MSSTATRGLLGHVCRTWKMLFSTVFQLARALDAVDSCGGYRWFLSTIIV